MQPEKILIRGVNWLGDAVMTTPALQRLREAHPKASITMLTQAKLADLWLHHPCLDGVIAIQPSEGLLSLASRLRKERFDTAVIFPNSPRSTLEAFLARIPSRIGYGLPWRSWLLTEALPANPFHRPMRKRPAKEIKRLIQRPGPRPAMDIPEQAHHVYHYLRIVAALGANPTPVAPSVGVTEQELEAVSLKWQLDRQSTTWIGLNPGAEYGPAKRWPADHFSAAAVALSRQLSCRFIIFGGRNDAPLADQIATRIEKEVVASPPSVLNLAGKTSLRELCALLRLCSVVVTNDSGPMHLAAAAGASVVVPFGSTSPALTGPGLSQPGRSIVLKTTVPCAPCFLRQCPIDLRCMHQHSAEQVVQAVLDLQTGAK